MEIELVLSFLSASLILSIMPGPDNIFVLTESVTKGHQNGIAISIGLSLGVMIHTLAAALGLSLIIQQSALVFSVIKYLGAAYLLYLAITALRYKSKSNKDEQIQENETMSWMQLIRKGFLMNVLNPKVSLFFIAFLPQFVSNFRYQCQHSNDCIGIYFYDSIISSV